METGGYVRRSGIVAGERRHAYGFESHPPHPASPGRNVLAWGNAFFWGVSRAAFAARRCSEREASFFPSRSRTALTWSFVALVFVGALRTVPRLFR